MNAALHTVTGHSHMSLGRSSSSSSSAAAAAAAARAQLKLLDDPYKKRINPGDLASFVNRNLVVTCFLTKRHPNDPMIHPA